MYSSLPRVCAYCCEAKLVKGNARQVVCTWLPQWVPCKTDHTCAQWEQAELQNIRHRVSLFNQWETEREALKAPEKGGKDG